MIAVTFALPNESRAFSRLLEREDGGVQILHTGVGARTCRERISDFLDEQRPEWLVSSGFAGGVDGSLGVGDLLLAENFSDPRLLARAQQIVFAYIGDLATADHIIASEAERENFARTRGALAVDMETQSIAEACAAHEIPMLSLRAISDTAAAPFPAPPAVLFDETRQRTEPLMLARHLLRHPDSMIGLVRFARQIFRARSSLTSALILLVNELR